MSPDPPCTSAGPSAIAATPQIPENTRAGAGPRRSTRSGMVFGMPGRDSEQSGYPCGGSSMNKATKTPRQHQVTRREFVGGALAPAGVLTGAPALLRGRNLNDKLNIAFI